MFSANSSQVSGDKLFVEDVFSTYLYTGTGSPVTINNGIDLAGKGGLVWIKARTVAYVSNLVDTARGVGKTLVSSSNSEQIINSAVGLTAFNSNGFTTATNGGTTQAGDQFVSWTFRKSAKFFDCFTYVGDGNPTRQISHNLGVVPGLIIVRRTDAPGGDWFVVAQGATSDWLLKLNLTDASIFSGQTYPYARSSTAFFPQSMDGGFGGTNTSGAAYMAYLFAHDATSDGIIQCGSYTADGSTYVNLGWEPQFVMVKRTDSTGDWFMVDDMRGFSSTPSSISKYLAANLGASESNIFIDKTATGFLKTGASGGTYIYIAIRKGPMR